MVPNLQDLSYSVFTVRLWWSVSSSWVFGSSVDFYGCIDFPNKEKGGIETNSACQKPESHHHHERVGKVEEGGHEFINV